MLNSDCEVCISSFSCVGGAGVRGAEVSSDVSVGAFVGTASSWIVGKVVWEADVVASGISEEFMGGICASSF